MNPNRRIALIEQVGMIRDRKKQVYTFTVITFFVVIILAVGAIKPSIETIVRLQSEIREKKRTLTALEDKINTLNALSLQYAEFEETARDFELLYPSDGDMSLFLANIESLSEESGLDLNSIAFGKSKRVSSGLEVLSPITIQLSVEGERERLIPFLKKMESLPMYSVIQSVAFTLGDNNVIENEEFGSSEDNPEPNQPTDEAEPDADGEDLVDKQRFSIVMQIYEITNETFYE